MGYRYDGLLGPDPGDTLAMALNDGHNFSCCSGENIYRLDGSRPCVFISVGVRHRRLVGQIQGATSQAQ